MFLYVKILAYMKNEVKICKQYSKILAYYEKTCYLCIVFFMVLDLRLTIDGRRDDGHLFL